MTAGSTHRSTWGPTEREREHALLADLERTDLSDERRAAIRDELVTMHLPLVRHLARRYRDRGEDLDDLVQVGTVGLINAIDRFDPSRGVELSTFATPTILGEIKRHFRDRAWAVRVPRRLQELSTRLTATSDDLTRTLQRSPTVRELAAALGVSEEDVLDALEARHAFTADTLEGPDDDEHPGVGSTLGADEPAFEEIEDRESLRPLLAALPDRERRILTMRFQQHLSQAQIAQELGISQMHVSRLLARTLAGLRRDLTAD